MTSSSFQKKPLIMFYVYLSLYEAIMSKASISFFAFNFFLLVVVKTVPSQTSASDSFDLQKSSYWL